MKPHGTVDFLRVLLFVFVLVSASHIVSLGVGTLFCYQQGVAALGVLRDIARKDNSTEDLRNPPRLPVCQEIRADFSSAVANQNEIILALIGGTGLAATTLFGKKRDEDDET